MMSPLRKRYLISIKNLMKLMKKIIFSSYKMFFCLVFHTFQTFLFILRNRKLSPQIEEQI